MNLHDAISTVRHHLEELQRRFPWLSAGGMDFAVIAARLDHLEAQARAVDTPAAGRNTLRLLISTGQDLCDQAVQAAERARS